MLRYFTSFETGLTVDAGGFTSADGQWYGLLAHTIDAAKNGSRGIRTNGGGDQFTFGGNEATVIVGFHYRMLTGLNDDICRFFEGANYQLRVFVNTDGSVAVKRGGDIGGSGTVTLGTSAATGIVVVNTWHFIEVKFTINNATGSVEVRVDGVTALALSGIDTQNSANAYVTAMQICGPDGVNSADFDNFYFCDNTGTLNNDFLGEGEAKLLVPSGAGTSTQWTPLSSTNVSNVDDAATHDSDTTYNESSTATNKDLFALGDIPVTGGSVAGVKVTTVMRKTDGGVRQAANVINLGGGESQRATNTLTTSYVHYSEIFEVDPADSTPLTEAKVNAAEAGYILIA